MIPTHSSLLLLEDEALLRRRLLRQLQGAGFDVSEAASLAEAKRLLEVGNYELALLDIGLPDGSGLELIGKGLSPADCAVVMMTANADVSGAVEAIRAGAMDYVVKPFDTEDLLSRLERAWAIVRKRRGEQFHREQEEAVAPGFIFGASLGPLHSMVEKILAADARLGAAIPPPILIEGETGTGKTSLARWLHARGPRSQGPLVEVNCPALPDTLAESELFGHEKGAFTDARQTKLGLMEAAEGGTLFLDELSSLSLGTQARLLKAVEDHSIRRVGGNKAIAINVRIIAATNVDLASMVAQGRFRDDLRQRLDLFRLRLPPLRERGSDILALAESMVSSLCKRYRLPLLGIPKEGKERLLGYSWPGNVRELAHEIERSLVFEDDRLTFRRLLSTATPAMPFGPGFRLPAEGFSLERTIDDLVLCAMAQSQGNTSAAARLLGCTRDYVRYRIKSRNLKAECAD